MYECKCTQAAGQKVQLQRFQQSQLTLRPGFLSSMCNERGQIYSGQNKKKNQAFGLWMHIAKKYLSS